MPSLQTVRCSIFVGFASVVLVGCGQALTGTSDIQQVPGDVGALGAPPDAAAAIAFQTFDDDVGAQAKSRTRTLIRSASGYQSLFGHTPPAAIDFSHEWVMFYAAGTEPTNGYDASFLALVRSGSNLIAITQLSSPGLACVVGQSVTAPYALIKFPAQPGTSAQFFKNDVTKDCTCACRADPCATVDCGGGTHCDSGKCIPDGVPCGGLAGKACPGAGQCVDDPYDGCNPAAGGADCPGICACTAASGSCPAGTVFNGDPSVCSCVTPPPDPCAAVSCPTGTQCDGGKCVPICGPVCLIYCDYGNVLDANGCPTCACNPPPDPCANVKCAAGTHCDSGKCVSDGVSCGGLAGTACPGAGQCVDDPSDSCDPKAGGADCIGVCQCPGRTGSCPVNTIFDSSPSVCDCVPNTPPLCPTEKCPAPAPGVPTKICSDGTTAGPACTPNPDGTCGWTITNCAGS